MPRGRFGRRALLTGAVGTVLTKTTRTARADAAAIGIGYIRWAEQRQTVSPLDKPPRDDGLAGAKLAISDNNTTGRFTASNSICTDIAVRGTTIR